MRIDRGEIFIARMETVPAKRLNMALWVTRGFGVDDCGTAACGMGWACTIDEFQAAGLRLYPDPFFGPMPEFDGKFGYDAAMAFFEITKDEADYIFYARCYGPNPTPQDVIAHMRKVMERH